MKLVLDDGTEIPIENVMSVDDLGTKTKGIIIHAPIKSSMPSGKLSQYLKHLQENFDRYFNARLQMNVHILVLPVIDGQKYEFNAITINPNNIP